METYQAPAPLSIPGCLALHNPSQRSLPSPRMMGSFASYCCNLPSWIFLHPLPSLRSQLLPSCIGALVTIPHPPPPVILARLLCYSICLCFHLFLQKFFFLSVNFRERSCCTQLLLWKVFCLFLFFLHMKYGETKKQMRINKNKEKDCRKIGLINICLSM